MTSKKRNSNAERALSGSKKKMKKNKRQYDGNVDATPASVKRLERKKRKAKDNERRRTSSKEKESPSSQQPSKAETEAAPSSKVPECTQESEVEKNLSMVLSGLGKIETGFGIIEKQQRMIMDKLDSIIVMVSEIKDRDDNYLQVLFRHVAEVKDLLIQRRPDLIMAFASATGNGGQANL